MLKVKIKVRKKAMLASILIFTLIIFINPFLSLLRPLKSLELQKYLYQQWQRQIKEDMV